MSPAGGEKEMMVEAVWTVNVPLEMITTALKT
jgi:hypothetical protein